jgi:hypothetical protein
LFARKMKTGRVERNGQSLRKELPPSTGKNDPDAPLSAGSLAREGPAPICKKEKGRVKVTWIKSLRFIDS